MIMDAHKGMPASASRQHRIDAMQAITKSYGPGTGPHPTVPAVHAGQPASHPLTAPSAAAHAAGQPQTFRAGAPQNRHGYNPIAVDKAIASSNRAGRKIGGREASAIHRLLKGRH
jgi:hypothetical protein